MTKNIQDIYCIGSIPVDSGSIFINDIFEKKIKSKLNRTDYSSLDSIKKIKSFNTKGLQIGLLADGAYPVYVEIDKNKLIKKIFIELNNSCGWGTSYFSNNFRKAKLVGEIKAKEKMPKDFQIDVVAGVRSSVDFSSSHRLTYTPWEKMYPLLDEKKFLKNKNNYKYNLGNINIKNNFISFSDFPDMKISEINKIKKNIKLDEWKRYKPEDKFIFPCKNKRYPISLIFSKVSQEDQILSINKLEEHEQNELIFPILIIENIEGCKLNKIHDSSLFLEDDKNKYRGLSNYFWGQHDTQLEDPKIKDIEIKMCQLDFGDLSTITEGLKGLNMYSKITKKLTFRHFKHVKDWSVLLKFFDANELIFDNCNLDIDSKKKNSWLGVMSRYYVNRKNHPDLSSNFKIIVNGKEIDF